MKFEFVAIWDELAVLANQLIQPKFRVGLLSTPESLSFKGRANLRFALIAES